MDWDPPNAWDSLAASLRSLSARIATRPRAIIVVSAHWEAPEFTVTTAERPELIYDYYGFPKHTYELKYPAPGDPELAQRIVQRLQLAGLTAQTDAERGFDHGVFVPFLLIYPQADIPVVQLSLKAGLNPAVHLQAGRALAALRDDGVLIVGSGYSYHNMRGYGGSGATASREFDAWLGDVLVGDAPLREKRLLEWEQAPSARASHPREEHLLPLMVAAGAAGADAGQRIFSDTVFGVATSMFQFGGVA